MALGMKQWLAIVGGASALIAITALPPQTLEGNPNPVAPALARYRSVAREVNSVRRGLEARRRVDSLSSIVARDAVDGLALGLPERNEVTEEGLEEWKESLGEQLDTLSRRADETVIGFYFQSLAQGTEDGIRWPALRATFAGTHEGTDYCLHVVPDRDVFDADLRGAAESGLRECRLYAKYGMPGALVQEWLRAGNAAVATRSYRDPDLDLVVIAPTASGESRYGQYRLFPFDAPVFGMNRYLGIAYGRAPIDVIRCVAGDAEACAGAFTWYGADRAARSSATADELVITAEEELLDWGSGFVYVGEYLLADLELDFGEDAFARFWTSEEPVPEAFEGAFGVGIGDWMLGWVEAEIGLDDAGPELPSGTYLPTLLTFMALAAGASLAQSRRRVA